MAEYTNDLRLKEIATGDESGTWGTSTNTNLELIAEAFSYSSVATFDSDADKTETIADGSTDPYRSIYVKVTSGVSLTATRTLTIAPNTVSKIFMIENATSGSQSIAISQGSGANVTIPNGDVKVIYTDGAGAGAAVADAFASLNIGDLTATNIAGTLTTAAQTNITSVGTLTGFTSTGIDDNATSTALTITADENVGIGVTSITPISNRSMLSLGGTSGGLIDLQVGADIEGRIFASDGSLNLRAAESDGVLTVQTGGSTERMRIDSTGDVLINNTSFDLSGVLQVSNTNDNSEVNLILAESERTGAVGAGLVLHHKSTSPAANDYNFITFSGKDAGDANASYAQIRGLIDATTAGAEQGNLAFLVANAGSLAERMRIDHSGNVGIGTTSPNEILELSQNQNPHIRFNNADTSVLANDIFGTLEWYTNDPSSSGTGIAAEIRAYADVDFAGSTRSTNIDFLTASGASSPTTRMTIHHDGNVGIGTSSPTTTLDVVNSSAGNSTIPLVIRNSGSASVGTETKLFLSTVADNERGAFISAKITDASNGNAMLFATNTAGASPSERMRVDSSGNVGIGTTSTTHKFNINSNGNTNSVAQIVAADSRGASRYALDIIDSDANSRGSVRISTTSGPSLTTTGNVGIGTSSPLATFDVEAPSGNFVHQITNGSEAEFALRTYNQGSSGSNVAVFTQGLYYSATENSAIRYHRGLGGSDGFLSFTSSGTERMRISSNGNLGLGTSSDSYRLFAYTSAGGSYTAAFQNDGNSADCNVILAVGGADNGSGTTNYLFAQDGNGSDTGAIRTVSGVFQLVDISDRRTKQDIVDTTINGLETVNNMRVVDFAYKTNPSQTVQAGFIAQELQEVFAPAVSGEETENDKLAVSRERLVPILVKAIQEQQEQIESLKSEIELLKGGN